jgi:hypothetical protein
VTGIMNRSNRSSRNTPDRPIDGSIHQTEQPGAAPKQPDQKAKNERRVVKKTVEKGVPMHLRLAKRSAI